MRGRGEGTRGERGAANVEIFFTKKIRAKKGVLVSRNEPNQQQLNIKNNKKRRPSTEVLDEQEAGFAKRDGKANSHHLGRGRESKRREKKTGFRSYY